MACCKRGWARTGIRIASRQRNPDCSLAPVCFLQGADTAKLCRLLESDACGFVLRWVLSIDEPTMDDDGFTLRLLPCMASNKTRVLAGIGIYNESGDSRWNQTMSHIKRIPGADKITPWNRLSQCITRCGGFGFDPGQGRNPCGQR